MRLDLNSAALVVVDVQQGFTSLCPKELPVSGGLEIVPVVNRLLDLPWRRIDATQDWHPINHCSFLGQRDNIYPSHCVAGTPGAEFVPDLNCAQFHAIWRKGFRKDFEAYAVTAEHPAFANFLHASGVRTVAVCGIATNICCFFTARDLRLAGFEVILLTDASAGIDVPAADFWIERAQLEGEVMGINYLTTQQIQWES